MGTNYPGGLDAFNNPSPGQSRSDPGYEEWELFTDLNDSMEAVQGELGTNPSGGFDTVADALNAALVYSSDVEPDPAEHPLWFDENTAILYFWFAGAATPVWVEV